MRQGRRVGPDPHPSGLPLAAPPPPTPHPPMHTLAIEIQDGLPTLDPPSPAHLSLNCEIVSGCR